MKEHNFWKAGKICLGILSVFLFTESLISGSEDTLPELKTDTKTVAVFKNGLGFFIKDGKTDLKNGWAVYRTVPEATYGTLWIGSVDKEITLDEVVGFVEEVRKEKEVGSLAELLKHNTGRSVKVTAQGKIIEGNIQYVSKNIVVISAASNFDVVLNIKEISKIEFPETCVKKYDFKKDEKALKFKVSPLRGNVRINMAYLQKGISWAPSYLVNIEHSDKARIIMKATLINDIEDLHNVDAYFVVGYPNFTFSDIFSPMAMKQTLSQLIGALERGRDQGIRTDQLSSIMRQSVSFGRETTTLDPGYSSIKDLQGASEEDLFLYNKKGVTLKKGERACYYVFSQEVEYKHIYEWNIPDTINVDQRGYRTSVNKDKDKEQVWHSVKLTNSTDYPWTTAPALTVSGWKPLSQDMVAYTPKGTKINLKLTVATDIKTERNEYESSRERDVRLYKSTYDLVTVEGELYMKNAKTKDVTMEIKKRITGEVLKTSPNGKVKKIAEGLKGANYNSFISWEIPVEAGEEVMVTYTYKVYIHN